MDISSLLDDAITYQAVEVGRHLLQGIRGQEARIQGQEARIQGQEARIQGQELAVQGQGAGSKSQGLDSRTDKEHSLVEEVLVES